MALETWNGRTASQTDADSPLDTTLMDGLRKDIDHIRQALYGSTDPSSHTPVWGHDHDGTNSKLVVLASQAAGDYLLIGNPDMRSLVTTSSYAKIKEIKVGVGGTFRIKFDACKFSGACQAKIYRNGAAVGTEQSVTGGVTTDTSTPNGYDYTYDPSLLKKYVYKDGTYFVYGDYITYSEDIGGWSPGDLVQIYVKNGGNAYVKDFNIYTAGPPIAGAVLGY